MIRRFIRKHVSLRTRQNLRIMAGDAKIILGAIGVVLAIFFLSWVIGRLIGQTTGFVVVTESGNEAPIISGLLALMVITVVVMLVAVWWSKADSRRPRNGPV